MSRVTYTQRVAVICLVMVIAMLSPSVTRSQDTPGAVVDAWSVAMTLMDESAYEYLLSDTYRFVNTPFPPYPEDLLSRDLDLISTANLFSGRVFEDPDTGMLMAPITSITIHTLVPLAEWTQVPPEHPLFPNTQSTLYDLYMVLHGEMFSISIPTLVIFYVREMPRANEDPLYTIEGLEEISPVTRNEDVTLTQIKWRYANAIVANESSTWGRVKTLYER